MADAIIKVGADMSQAEAKLAAYYASLARGGSVNVGANGGGGPGMGTIAGGVALGNMAGWFANRMGVSTTVDALKDAAFLQIAGEQNVGRVSSAVASRDSVAGRFGSLYAMGLVNDDFLQKMYDIDQKYGSGLQAKGESMIRGKFGIDVAEAFGEASLGVLERIANTLLEIGGKLGNAVGDAVGLPRLK